MINESMIARFLVQMKEQSNLYVFCIHLNGSSIDTIYLIKMCKGVHRMFMCVTRGTLGPCIPDLEHCDREW